MKTTAVLAFIFLPLCLALLVEDCYLGMYKTALMPLLGAVALIAAMIHRYKVLGRLW